MQKKLNPKTQKHLAPFKSDNDAKPKLKKTTATHPDMRNIIPQEEYYLEIVNFAIMWCENIMDFIKTGRKEKKPNPYHVLLVNDIKEENPQDYLLKVYENFVEGIDLLLRDIEKHCKPAILYHTENPSPSEMMSAVAIVFVEAIVFIQEFYKAVLIPQIKASTLDNEGNLCIEILVDAKSHKAFEECLQYLQNYLLISVTIAMSDPSYMEKLLKTSPKKPQSKLFEDFV